MEIAGTDRGIISQLNGTSLELVRIPAGSFLMGSSEEEHGSRANEQPLHAVHVPAFYLGIYPVTQIQWRSVMRNLPAIEEAYHSDSFPVVNVGLDEAYEFCRRLTDLTSLEFRLPSEAEWEYACRAGTQTPFSWGETISTHQVNFSDARQGEPLSPGLRAVGFSGVANAFGLYDMHGNVWEWCSDRWHDDYVGAPFDGSAWTRGGDAGYHVQRGGSWQSPAVVCRSAFRVGDIARNTDHIVGLRVCTSSRELAVVSDMLASHSLDA
jgi:formylglycine-generating enzyme required for sulfatase activity